MITVKSAVHVGTTFYVWLPAKETENLQAKDGGQSLLLRGKGKVLLMDDDEMVREAAGNMLTHMGYDVTLAQDGREAVALYLEALATNLPYDAAIMDLTVPGGMGGSETIQELIAVDARVKAIVSSGYANDPIMSDYRKWGFSGVVVKPYKTEELSKVVHQVITGSG